MKKYENKQAEGKVRKENKDMTRNLCFHDWLIVRELKVLDDVYDDMLRQVNYRILDLLDIEDSDERQQKYDKILEERETLRAIYIQRRNELKAGFTDRQEREVGEKGWRKIRKEAFEFHKYTPEELEEMEITKGTLAKGQLHPDDVGKELTIDMLNRVIWESAEEE